jgi:hypothetical protein
MSSEKSVRVLVVGCGNMGTSHAMAYHTQVGFEICGIVSTGKSKDVLNTKLGGGYPLFDTYELALEKRTPMPFASPLIQIRMRVLRFKHLIKDAMYL